jgi:integrase/recombinase XerD
VAGFAALLQRFERNIAVLGRSPRTFAGYSRYVAAMALHFNCLSTELDPEQVQDSLFLVNGRYATSRSKPSESLTHKGF